MNRLVKALLWACGTATLAFMVLFITPLAIGGSGASLAPVFAFLVTPVIFVATLLLALVWPPLSLVVIAVTLFYPAWYYSNTPARDPLNTFEPLTAQEQALVRSRHFEAHVAVDGGRFPPIYRADLIEDLGQAGLFSSVSAVEKAPSADLVATVTGSYYGDKLGHSFSLRWSRQPERSVSVKTWHYSSDGPFLYASSRRRQVDRLALEVVRQMDALGPPPATR